MKFGVVLTGTDQDVLELGREAEAAGWDGVFLPDDWGAALIRLTAIAMRTERVRLGTMLTPLPQHLPWIVAAQSATLDQLCGGRMILGLGLGVNARLAGKFLTHARTARICACDQWSCSTCSRCWRKCRRSAWAR